MPAGIRAPDAAMKIVVLSPSMSSQMRCDSANCRPPNPVPSIFSSNPAIERSRSTWTGRVGIVRYLLGFGLRCVTISSSALDILRGLCGSVMRMTRKNIHHGGTENTETAANNHDDGDHACGYH